MNNNLIEIIRVEADTPVNSASSLSCEPLVVCFMLSYLHVSIIFALLILQHLLTHCSVLPSL